MTPAPGAPSGRLRCGRRLTPAAGALSGWLPCASRLTPARERPVPSWARHLSPGRHDGHDAGDAHDARAAHDAGDTRAPARRPGCPR